MSESYEQLEKKVFLGGTNKIQIQLAGLFFGGLTPEKAIEKWLEEGYSKRFRNILDENPDFKERIKNSDWTVTQEIFNALKENEK